MANGSSVPRPVGERGPSGGAHLKEREDIAISVLHGFGDQGRNSAGSVTRVRLSEGWEPIACPEITLQSRAAQPAGIQRVLLARATGKSDHPPMIFWAG